MDVIPIFGAFPDSELGSTPEFHGHGVIEGGVELQRRATPNSGRRWKTDRDTSPDIGMGVEEAFVGHFDAADNGAGALEISLESGAEDSSLLRQIV